MVLLLWVDIANDSNEKREEDQDVEDRKGKVEEETNGIVFDTRDKVNVHTNENREETVDERKGRESMSHGMEMINGEG